MADDIDESQISRKAKVIVGRAHPDRFTALAVQVAPISSKRRRSRHTQGIGAGDFLAVRKQTQFEIAFFRANQVFNHKWPVAMLHFYSRRQSLQSMGGDELNGF